MTVRIAILDDYQQAAQRLADWGALPADAAVSSFADPITDQEALIAALQPFEVVCAMRERTPFPAAVLSRLPNCRLLITSGARNAAIDLKAAAENGITVCGTRGGGYATVELTWGLILAAMRQIPASHDLMRGGGWQGPWLGRELRGRNLGILGLGRLGSEVARVGQAFGMTLLAWSQNLTEERAAQCGARRVALAELLRQADVVTIHLLLSRRTRGLIGAEELAAMRPDAWLVNTSRGPIVQEAALIEALRQGTIAGAAIDVYDREPLPADHALRNLDNVVLTPHLGYVTEESLGTFYRGMVAGITAWLEGAPEMVLAQPEA